MKANPLRILTLITPLALLACGGEADPEESGNSGDEVAQGNTGDDSPDHNQTPEANGGNGAGSPGSSGGSVAGSSGGNSAHANGDTDEGNAGGSDDIGDTGESESSGLGDDSSDMNDGSQSDGVESGGVDAGSVDAGSVDEPAEIDSIGPDGGEPAERDSLTASECEAAGGTVVGDPGDGSVHRSDYLCDSTGEPPIASIRPADGEPLSIEGAVCCGSKAEPQIDSDCGQIECFRAIECVAMCGGPVRQSGCCPCPEGTFDSIECDQAAGGNAAGCTGNSDCGLDEYCAKPAGECSVSGECVAEPDGCLDVYDPVCGCDGVSYSNSCQAASAGVSIGAECDE